MTWKKFDPVHGRNSLPPNIVSMQSNGRLTVTPIANELGEWIDVWCDKEGLRIALVPNGSRLKVTNMRNSKSISLLGVFKEMGIALASMKGHYKVKRDETTGLPRDSFVVDFKNGKV